MGPGGPTGEAPPASRRLKNVPTPNSPLHAPHNCGHDLAGGVLEGAPEPLLQLPIQEVSGTSCAIARSGSARALSAGTRALSEDACRHFAARLSKPLVTLTRCCSG